MGDGFSRGMGERDRGVIHSQFLRELGRHAVEHDRRTSPGLPLNLDVAPAYAVIPSSTQRFHARFLGGKTSREPFHAVGFRLAIADFSLGEDALQKTVTKALDRGSHARHFDDIDAGSYDHVSKNNIVASGTNRAASKQLIALVDHVFADSPRLSHELMWFGRTGTVNVQNLMPVCNQVVGNEHAVTTKIDSLRAHICGTRMFAEFDEFSDRGFEFGAQHVVGIIPKARVAQAAIGGIFSRLLAISTESFHPDVRDSVGGQLFLQVLAIEVRQPARHGKGTNIHQRLNGMGLQNFDELRQSSRGMPDTVESSQRK